MDVLRRHARVLLAPVPRLVLAGRTCRTCSRDGVTARAETTASADQTKTPLQRPRFVVTLQDDASLIAVHVRYLFCADVLKNLVGADNARRGVIKLFEVLQDEKLNRHLLYVSVCHVIIVRVVVSSADCCWFQSVWLLVLHEVFPEIPASVQVDKTPDCPVQS